MSLRAAAVLIVPFVSASSFAEPMPADRFDLSVWKLTLPYDTDRPGSPDEVLQPDLATFVDAACFYVSPKDDTLVFRAACDGEQTVNSKYPRCELREMQPGGEDEVRWGTDDGQAHSLVVDLAVTRLPEVKDHVVVVQIHDRDDDVLMVRVEGKKLLIERNGADDLYLSRWHPVGERVRLKIVASDGRIRAWRDDRPVMDWETDRQGCYFKTGCYPQSNWATEQQPGSLGEVRLHQLEVSHRPRDEPQP